jgi:hypothetical protein
MKQEGGDGAPENLELGVVAADRSGAIPIQAALEAVLPYSAL